MYRELTEVLHRKDVLLLGVVILISILLILSTGCMGINLPVMPKLQPMNVPIKQPAPIMPAGESAPAPTPATNATPLILTQTKAPKFVYV